MLWYVHLPFLHAGDVLGDNRALTDNDFIHRACQCMVRGQRQTPEHGRAKQRPCPAKRSDVAADLHRSSFCSLTPVTWSVPFTNQGSQECCAGAKSVFDYNFDLE